MLMAVEGLDTILRLRMEARELLEPLGKAAKLIL
jgi:hypothetical protein